MSTVTIPLEEYLALQRLVGFANSITNEKHVTCVPDDPFVPTQWHHPVTAHWRESLLAHAQRAERLSDRKDQP